MTHRSSLFFPVQPVEEGEEFGDDAVGFDGNEPVDVDGGEQFEKIGIVVDWDIVFARYLHDLLGDQTLARGHDSRRRLACLVVAQGHSFWRSVIRLVH